MRIRRSTSILAAAVLALGVANRLVAARGEAEPTHRSQSREAWDAAPLRVLVLGGGFGGIAAARALDRTLRRETGASVLLIDRCNAQLFIPLLWPVAAGRSSAEAVLVPLRARQRGYGFHVLHADVKAIDVARRVVATSAGDYGYDRLVIALGSAPAIPASLPGAREHALPFHSVADAIGLRNHVARALERAHRSTDSAERTAWLTFVVIGGGDTGTELAAVIAEFARGTIASAYPWLVDAAPRVVVLEAADRLLPLASEALARHVRRSLERSGVDVRTGVTVARISNDAVTLADGEIPARTVFWSAGDAPPELVRDLPLEHARNGAVVVDATLRARGRDDVYVVGDASWIADDAGAPVPALAQAAQREGAYVARAIAANVRGRAVRPFRFRSRGELTLLGRFDAVARIGPLLFGGPVAWLAWHAYYALAVGSARVRMRLIAGWLASALAGPATSEIPLEAATE